MAAKNMVLWGAVFGFFAIMLGAFGAHALKQYLDPAQLVSFETGVRYQMYHALFLLLVSRLQITDKTRRIILLLTVVGTILFSGSIYLLTTREITSLDIRPVGFLTPIGGTLLIVAWLLLFIDFMRKKS